MRMDRIRGAQDTAAVRPCKLKMRTVCRKSAPQPRRPPRRRSDSATGTSAAAVSSASGTRVSGARNIRQSSRVAWARSASRLPTAAVTSDCGRHAEEEVRQLSPTGWDSPTPAGKAGLRSPDGVIGQVACSASAWPRSRCAQTRHGRRVEPRAASPSSQDRSGRAHGLGPRPPPPRPAQHPPAPAPPPPGRQRAAPAAARVPPSQGPNRKPPDNITTMPPGSGPRSCPAPRRRGTARRRAGPARASAQPVIASAPSRQPLAQCPRRRPPARAPPGPPPAAPTAASSPEPPPAAPPRRRGGGEGNRRGAARYGSWRWAGGGGKGGAAGPCRRVGRAVARHSIMRPGRPM